MADTSGISSTSLELLLEFDNDYTDTSANGRDQNPVIGAAQFASDGSVGQAAKFRYADRNHIDTGVNALGSADLFCASGSNDFTVSTFLRFEGASRFGAGTICARQEGTGIDGIATSNFFLHVTTDRKLLVRLRGQDNYYTPDMHDGEWHHVGVTWDGTTATVYFDGASLGTAQVGGVAENTTDIFIGGSYLPDITGLPTSNLVGQLDDFRIYSRAWTAGEMNQHYLYGPGSGGGDSSEIQPEDLELHLKYEGDLLDSSVHARHQTANIQNGPLTFVAGQEDSQASAWDASSLQYIATGVEAFGGCTLFSDSGDAWSVSVWVKNDDAGGGIGMVIAKKMQSTGFRLQITNGGANLTLRGQLNNYTLTGNDDGEWHHYAVTWNGSAAAFYYDGSAQSVPSNGTDTIGSEDILIGTVDTIGGGTPANFSLHFDEHMDGLRLYSRALSSDDVGDLANETPTQVSAVLSITAINDAVASLQVVFSTSVTGFASGDVTATNGSVSNVAGSGTTYAFDVTAAANGVVTAKVDASTVTTAGGVDNSESNTVSWGIGGVAGGGDGLSRFDRTVAPTHTASVLIGPVMISPNTFERSVIQRMRMVFGSGTTATGSVLVSCGVDGEDAVTRAEDDGHQYSTTIAAVQNNAGVVLPRVGGHAAVFQIDVTSGHLTFEGGDVQLKPAGRNRAARYT